ncbi:MAG: DNA adenine methylase [Tannerellaceae bacterium]|nr:DNA adenine methylase [Tannerellaceae bacterium]
MKMYTSAPIPFQGQKRFFLKEYKEALSDIKPSIDTVVDLFGGSGLLSHVAKRMFPDLRVIYNDYDDFHQRLENIETTNRILNKIRTYVVEYPKEKKLPEEVRKHIVQILREEHIKGSYIDSISLSSSLMFSAKYANSFEELGKQTFYNNVKKSDYHVDSYLEGLEIVKMDYRLLYEKYKEQGNILFIIDPPYLSTNTKTYKSDTYWRLTDYLQVLTVLQDENYIYHTSEKSELLELCEWFSTNIGVDYFKGSKIYSRYNQATGTRKYKDIMIYRKKQDNKTN